MKRSVALGVVLVLFLGGPLAADCRSRVVVQRQAVVNHHVAAVVTPVAVAQFVAVPVAVPTYSVGPSHQSQTDIDAIARALDRLTAAVERLGKGGVQQPDNSLEAKALSVLNARCAQCHTGAQAKGKLTIFARPGELSATLNTLDLVAMLEEVKAGRMPKAPAPPLEDGELLILQEWTNGQVKAARASLKK